MNPLRRVRVIIFLLVIGLLGLVPAAAGAQTEQDVDRAQDQKEQAYRDLVEANQAVGQALADLEAISEELVTLEYTIDKLSGRITEYDDRVADLDDSARDVVVEAYISGGTGLVSAAFAAGTIQDLLTSQVLIDSAADRDLASLDLLTAVNRENDRLKEELDQKRAEVADLQEQQAALVEQLDDAREHAEDVLAYAEANYADVYRRYKEELRRQAEEEARRQREEEARRQAEAAAQSTAASSGGSTSTASSGSSSGSSASPSSSGSSGSSDSSSGSSSSDSGSSGSAPGAGGLPPSSTPGVVCPVAGNTWFVNTWGAPRSGGRTHKGVDMAAARGTPLVAMDNGKVRVGWHYAGGRQVYVYADNGTFYYYAHLSGYASGLASGQRVAKGQIIGYVGSTGNASTSHLHLGMGPRSGVYVNPYPTVAGVC
jgi:murein DD-endopeptidase MepM/ murein hydrolase activator NlpD